MGVIPHALFSCLKADLSDAIPSSSLERILGGEMEWPGISYRERAAASIHSSLLKKLETGMTKETQRKALVKFLQVDKACLEWDSQHDNQFGDDYLLGEFKNYIWKFWHLDSGQPLVEHHYDVLCKGGVGPGASIKSPGGDFYTKLFSSSLSVTDLNLYHWYRRYIRSFPEWCNAENSRSATYGDPVVVEGNRLSFVPKNDDISRSICTEPTLNQFYQLGFGAILESRIESFFGIRLKTQQFKNRELARKGSWDGSFSTIDLSSASDSISLKMLRSFLPKDFLSYLEKYRSPQTRMPDGKLHSTNMVSTMGNGFTFPLQTLIFGCVVLSAFRMSGLAPRFPRGSQEGNFGVNGDDIVVPSAICAKVLRLLRLLGFTPNDEKTFVEGPFRESCGGDYFLGRNLRGVFVKRLDEPQDLYSVINQLNLFSTRTGILLPKTVQLLLKKVKYLPVPRWENDDSGIKVPSSLVRNLPKDLETQSTLYYAWTPNPPPVIRIADSALFIPRSYKPRKFNLSGLFLSFLQGSVNSNTIPLLPKRVRYKRKPRIAPNWDNPFKGDSEDGDAMTIQLLKGWFDWERWNTVTYLNLFK